MDRRKARFTELAIYAFVGIVAILLLIISACYMSGYPTIADLLVGISANLLAVSGIVIFIRYALHWHPEEESQDRQESLLGNVKNTLESILASYTFGVQFLENVDAVNLELTRIVRRAEDTIFALGARSKTPEYLQAIEEAVVRRHVTYHRLINAHHIQHELHEHLERLIDAPNVRVSWTPKQKFSNLTVTESECVLVFPAPSSDKLSGLKLPSQANSQRYRRYFFEASEASITIESKFGIKCLCESCSPNTSRKPREIRQILLQEFEKSSNDDNDQ